MKKEKFEQCPMYHKSNSNGTKLTTLEMNMEKLANTSIELREDVDKLISNQTLMKKDIEDIKSTSIAQYEKANKVYEGLEAHMEDEADHNIRQSQEISELTLAVSGLVDDNVKYRKQRQEEEEAHKIEEALKKQEEETQAKLDAVEKEKADFRKGIYSKVLGAVLSFLAILILGFMWEAFGYFQEAKRNHTITQAHIANQEQLLRYEQLKAKYEHRVK